MRDNCVVNSSRIMQVMKSWKNIFLFISVSVSRLCQTYLQSAKLSFSAKLRTGSSLARTEVVCNKKQSGKVSLPQTGDN